MKTGTKILKFAGIGAIVVLLSGSMACNFTMLKRIEKVEQSLKAETEKNMTHENEVLIAGEYTIHSTEHISNAYKSGDVSQLDKKDKETLTMAEKILKKIIKDDMSDYEKERAVYDWMTKNLKTDSGMLTVIPGTESNSDNPYGVLKDRKAICVGYATTFRLFMQMMDIECMVIHNTDEVHSWNLVKLDENWYHTDIYSDVGTGNYKHFNLSDAMQNTMPNWDTDFFPAASSYEYCYSYQNSTKCKDIYEIPAKIRKILDKLGGNLNLRFTSDEYDKNQQKISVMLENIEVIVYSAEQTPSLAMTYDWTKVEDDYLLGISINQMIEEEEEEVPVLKEEELDKINQSIEKSFGDVEIRNVDDLMSDYSYGDITADINGGKEYEGI